jgi:hypothetical protein
MEDSIKPKFPQDFLSLNLYNVDLNFTFQKNEDTKT